MIVSPSNAHELMLAVLPNNSVLYEVLSLPMFRYRLVLVDWMLPEMVKYSEEASGPITTMEANFFPVNMYTYIYIYISFSLSPPFPHQGAHTIWAGGYTWEVWEKRES